MNRPSWTTQPGAVEALLQAIRIEAEGGNQKIMANVLCNAECIAIERAAELAAQAATQGDCCGNPAQCWEPCGELGKSAEHARRATPEETAKIQKALAATQGADVNLRRARPYVEMRASTDPEPTATQGAGGEGLGGAELCSDCPPVGYPTDKTRCDPCPRAPTPAGQDALLAAARQLIKRMRENAEHEKTAIYSDGLPDLSNHWANELERAIAASTPPVEGETK